MTTQPEAVNLEKSPAKNILNETTLKSEASWLQIIHAEIIGKQLQRFKKKKYF
jgi:hypothetical protein